MAVQFGPLGSATGITVSGSSLTTAIGTLPSVAPAIALWGVSAGAFDTIYYKLGTALTTVSLADGQRAAVGTHDDPLIIPVAASQTHIAIITEGLTGGLRFMPGQMVNGAFAPAGASQIIAVTNTDQRVALPALGTPVSAFTLVAMQGGMDSLFIKLGNSGVTGDTSSSMKIGPGSPDDPNIIVVTNSETHLSIFCEGSPGDVILTPGKVVADPAQAVPVTGGTITGNLTINQTAAGNSSLIIIGGQPGVGNPNIEIGRVDGTVSTPHIDFHSGAAPTDYDCRIRGTGGTGANGQGTLNIEAATFSLNSNKIVAPASPAQGDVIYYNGTNWVRLPAGTAGQALLTQGAGANPAWGASGGLTTIASGSLPAATTQSITNIPATFAYLILALSGVSSNTASRQPFVRVSTDNGSTFDSTAGNYAKIQDLNDAVGTFTTTWQATNASLIESLTLAAASNWTSYIYIFGYQGGMRMRWFSETTESNDSARYQHRGFHVGTSAINALQILWSGTGNFDAGTYSLFGVS